MATTQKLVMVVDGDVKVYDGSSTATPTGGDDAQAATGVVRMQEAFGKVYIIDKDNANIYDPAADTPVYDWPTDVTNNGEGAFPTDSGSDYARLIALYRGRIVLAGFPAEPQSWYMSRVGDPSDWDTGAVTGRFTVAVKGVAANFGATPQPITALIPVTDDLFIFGQTHSIWMLHGDPAAQGKLLLLTDKTGIVWGDAWTKDPEGNIYFFGTNGVYRLTPGQLPTSLTNDRLGATMRAVDTSDREIRLEWDTHFDGLHVFITQVSDATSTHFFWSRETDSWWPDQYINDAGPMATCVIAGDQPAERGILLGGRTGDIYRIDPTATSDDGTAISSYVWIGPIRADSGDTDVLLDRLAIVLGENTTGLDVEVFVGNAAEAATGASAMWKVSHTSGGRKIMDIRRAQANAIYLKLSNATLDKIWSVEEIVATVVHPQGLARRGGT